ncbi:MAG: hypothetical protein U0175_24210 [Caldilineaceae bacterium]
MSSLLGSFAVHLVVIFGMIHLIALYDLKTRQDESLKSLPEKAELFLGNYWFFLDKWITFLRGFLILFGAISSYGTLLLSGDKPIGMRIADYASFVLPTVAVFGLPLLVGRHMLFHPLGLTLGAYAEFAVTPDRLFYRFYKQWYSISFREIRTVRPIKHRSGRAIAYDIQLCLPVGIPILGRFQFWKVRRTSNLLVLVLLPNSLRLKQKIETSIYQQTAQLATEVVVHKRSWPAFDPI